MNMLSPSLIKGLESGRISARHVYGVDIQNRMNVVIDKLSVYTDAQNASHGLGFSDWITSVFNVPFKSLDPQRQEFLCFYVNRASFLICKAIKQQQDPNEIQSLFEAIFSAAKQNAEAYSGVDSWDHEINGKLTS